MALVQLTHLGNSETLEAEIFQTCFLNIFAPFFFFCHLPELTFIKAFETIFLWKPDRNLSKAINRSIPVNGRFTNL